MQQWLGVTAWLLFTFEDQVRGCLESDSVEARSHVDVRRITCVLTINNRSHALQAVFNLFAGTDTVFQPVSNVLRRDTQRCAVFHQANVVDVWHFRTTNTCINPANNVTQDTLTVVVDLLLNLFFSQS